MSQLTSAFTMTTTTYDFTNGNKLRVVADHGVIQSADVMRAGKRAGSLAARPAWELLNEWRAKAENLGITVTKSRA
jgi:hypothetical protein